MLDASAAAPPPTVAVDPAIRAIIVDPAAPRRIPKPVKLPHALPGHHSPLHPVRATIGFVREGIVRMERDHARFGDIYCDAVGSVPAVTVWDPDQVHRILRNEEQAFSTAMGWDQLLGRFDAEDVNGGTLSLTDFDVHKASRRLVQPAFSARALKGYIDIAQAHLRQVVPSWIQRGHIGFKAEARSLLGTIAGELFTGLTAPDELARVDRALVEFWSAPLSLVKHPRLSPTYRRAKRGYTTLRDTFTALIPERRANPGTDLFSHLCQVPDGETPADDVIIPVFLNVMFGAFDTTSLAVTSMAYLLARHPEWQARLREEALSLDARDIDWGSLRKLEQFELAWKETLRLLPLGSVLPRRTLREVTISGYRLPAGTFLGPAIGGLGRDPRFWTDPLRFDPERFAPGRAEDKQHPALFLPFGHGAHSCVGMQLALLEAKLLFHTLLTRCRFELAPDYQPHHTLSPIGCVSGKVGLKLMR